MKRKSKVIIIILIVVVILGGGFYYLQSRKGGQTEYTTAEVKRQDLTQTVSATGKIKSAEEIELSFAAAGRITNVYVKVGDKVKANQILARLDSSDLAVQLRQYQASLASAEANLEKLLAGASTEEVAVSKKGVDSAEVAYQAALVGLDSARVDKEQNMTIYEDTAVSDMSNYIFKARASLDVVEQIYNTSTIKDYLSVNNSQYLLDAKSERTSALSLLAASEQKVNAVKVSKDFDQTITALADVDSSLDQTAECLNSMFNALLNSVTSTTLTETMLDGYKTNIIAEQTTINAGISAMQTDRSNLQTKKLYYENAITTAQNTVDSTRQAWELAKAKYDLTVADPKAGDVGYYRAMVDQARAQVASVQQKMSDRLIKAPVDGVITKVNSSVGEQSSLATAVISMLGNQKFEIEVDVPESDIAKISVGNKTNLTLDAFGDDVPFTGAVVLIEPAETEISGVVYYKVNIGLDQTDKEIKSGMTANVDILTNKREGVLVIPQRAVVEKDGKKTVQVMVNAEDKKIEEREVTTGLRGDDGLIEITSGLSEGESVVTYTKNGA